jgi:hypothetical protein
MCRSSRARHFYSRSRPSPFAHRATASGRPARLEITLFIGDIEVRTCDGNEIIVSTDAEVRSADEPEPARPDGLRRIQTSSVGMIVEENANTVSVLMDCSRTGADIEVQMPRRTSVRASLVNGGDVKVVGLTGEHELANVNGDVIAEDISGSAVTNSTNGDVDIALPANLSADLIVASQQGDVYTDFDVAAENIRHPSTATRSAAKSAGACSARRAMPSAAAAPTSSSGRSTATS